jgi:type I restriction enzyme, S subunit
MVERTAHSAAPAAIVQGDLKPTEVGLLPRDWSAPQLREDVQLLSGQHVLAQYCNTDGRGVPYLTGPSDFPEGKIRHTKYTTSPTTLCAAGDILITVKGSGAGKLARADQEYCISRQLMAIRPREWSSRYTEYALANSRTIAAAASGLIPGISREQILDIRIGLPPTEAERTAIADALSDAESLIEALEELLDKKRALKSGLAQLLLTGQSRLPGFESDWVPYRLGDLVEFKNGLNKAKKFFGSGTPIVNYMDVFTSPHLQESQLHGRVTVNPAERENYSARKGDVFFTRTSETVEEIGMASVLMEDVQSAVFSGFVLRARPLQERLNSTFAGYVLRAEHVRRQIMSTASYTTRALTNGRLLAAVTVALPDCKEQHEIGEVLQDIDQELNSLDAQLTKARHLRHGMMRQLLSGQVRIA